jgi:hypothetical protein
MPIPPESLQPAHDKLRDIWQISSTEENRIQECIRNTPDPMTGVNPEREDMIRSFEIVRAHRRYTRSCIDALAWGEQVDHLSLPQDKAKAIRATEAAETFEKAIDSAHSDLTERLYDLCHTAGFCDSAIGEERKVLEEDIKAILRNFTYAFHSARADLRKGTR